MGKLPFPHHHLCRPPHVYMETPLILEKRPLNGSSLISATPSRYVVERMWLSKETRSNRSHFAAGFGSGTAQLRREASG